MCLRAYDKKNTSPSPRFTSKKKPSKTKFSFDLFDVVPQPFMFIGCAVVIIVETCWVKWSVREPPQAERVY